MDKSSFSGAELRDFQKSKGFFMEIPIMTIVIASITFIGALVTLVYPFTEESGMPIGKGIAYTILLGFLSFIHFFHATVITKSAKKVVPEQLISNKGVMGKHIFRGRGDDRKVKLTTPDGELYFKCPYEYYQMFIGQNVEVFSHNGCIYIIRKCKK